MHLKSAVAVVVVQCMLMSLLRLYFCNRIWFQYQNTFRVVLLDWLQ